jgi:hypothetical protein
MNPARKLRGSGLPNAEAGTSVQHFPNGPLVTTIISFTDLSVGATGDNASLGIGKKIFSPGAGAQIISAKMSVGLTHSDVAAAADTPDVGLGTVIASGAVAVLGGTATFENILTGQTAANCTGTATVAGAANGVIATDVFLNVADGWANVTTTALTATGYVTLVWLNQEV